MFPTTSDAMSNSYSICLCILVGINTAAAYSAQQQHEEIVNVTASEGTFVFNLYSTGVHITGLQCYCCNTPVNTPCQGGHWSNTGSPKSVSSLGWTGANGRYTINTALLLTMFQGCEVDYEWAFATVINGTFSTQWFGSPGANPFPPPPSPSPSPSPSPLPPPLPPPSSPPSANCANTCMLGTCEDFIGKATCGQLTAMNCVCFGCCSVALPPPPPPLPTPPANCNNVCMLGTCADFESLMTCSQLAATNCTCSGCCLAALPPTAPPSNTTRSPPPPPQAMYSCDNATHQCVIDTAGVFASNTSCTAACDNSPPFATQCQTYWWCREVYGIMLIVVLCLVCCLCLCWGLQRNFLFPTTLRALWDRLMPAADHPRVAGDDRV